MLQNLIALIVTLTFFSISLFIVVKKYRGFVEEDHLGEIKFVSPAMKLIKSIVKKSFISIEMILVFISLYILSLNSAYVSTFSFSTHSLSVQPFFTLLAESSELISLDIYDKIFYKNYVAIVQVFDVISVDGNEFYPLLIRCRNIDAINNLSLDLINIFSTYCVDENTILIDRSWNDMLESSMVNVLGRYNIAKTDIQKLIDLELIPGVYVVHSVGTIGGLTLRIEDPKKIIVMPLTENIIQYLCLEKKCNIKTIVLSFNYEHLDESTINKFIDIFNYVVVKTNHEAVVYSRTYVPTLKSVVGMFLSFIISIIIVYAVSGGLVEKLINIGNVLFIEGITRDLFIAIVLLGIMISTLFTSIPILILFSLGLTNIIAIITYLTSSLGSTFIITSRLSGKISKYTVQSVANAFSYVVDKYISSDVLSNCLKSFLINDDFFHLDEIERVDGEHYVVRIELVYRKALTTVASVEVYVDKVNHGVKYTVVVDVWSIEDLSSRTLTSIHRLALSKIIGGVMSCIES